MSAALVHPTISSAMVAAVRFLKFLYGLGHSLQFGGARTTLLRAETQVMSD